MSVPPADARFGVISDIDDTILETGVQRVGHMVKQTITGSALTRTPFEGAAELYRAWKSCIAYPNRISACRSSAPYALSR